MGLAPAPCSGCSSPDARHVAEQLQQRQHGAGAAGATHILLDADRLQALRGQSGARLIGTAARVQIERQDADDQPAAIVADIVEDAIAAIEPDIVGEQRAHGVRKPRMLA